MYKKKKEERERNNNSNNRKQCHFKFTTGEKRRKKTRIMVCFNINEY